MASFLALLAPLLVLLTVSESRYSRHEFLTVRWLAEKWAPIVYLSKADKFRPSSVNYFLRNTKVVDESNKAVWQPNRLTGSNLPEGKPEYFLTTKEPLKCPDCTIEFFKGQDVDTHNVEVNAIYRHLSNHTLEITYWFFYPYNFGKVVCLGYVFRNYCPIKVRLSEHNDCYKVPNKDCPCSGEKINVCVGTQKGFGHHVGDWERVTIRFHRSSPWRRYQPVSMYLAFHNLGHLYNWVGDSFYRGNTRIQMKGSHPIVYSALGSHGTWPASGKFIYLNVSCNGEQLVDETDPGKEWKTWLNLRVIPYYAYKGHYVGQYSFLRFQGRWGNKEDGCELKMITGTCVLTNGPPAIPRSTLDNDVKAKADVPSKPQRNPSSAAASLFSSLIPQNAPTKKLEPFWNELRSEAIRRLLPCLGSA